MGCASSRAEESPLVALCRDRRDLIRSAGARRYALASAHASYSHSLSAVGAALHRFARDELDLAPSSPSLTIPSDEGKSSTTPPAAAASPEGSHIQFSSSSSSSEISSPSPSAAPTANNHNMRSSAGIPDTVYEDPYAGGQWPAYPGYGYGYEQPPYGVPEAAAPSSPPPPPAPEGSAWDFFNPFFSSYEQDLDRYYQGRYGAGSAASSPDSNEVREREGIPDLEEETEHEPAEVIRKVKKAGVEDVGTSNAVPLMEKKETAVVEERPVKSSSPEIESIPSSSGGEHSKGSLTSSVLTSSGEQAGSNTKGGSFSSLVTEESGMSNVDSLSAHDARDVTEVMDEIKVQFEKAAGFGKEVAGMLEVWRLPDQSGCGLLTVIYSRILDLMAPPPSSLHPSFKRRRLSSMSLIKNKISFADSEKHIGMKSGHLSSTLDKLYMWEKKLYKEVKDEEKLRIIYDKKCMQLKYLDSRGADPQKIDSILASIRDLSTKISVVIKSIHTISSRVHKIRDEELQPQLIELIQGLIRMWKSLLDCHQKQFRAICDSKSHSFVVKIGVQRNSVAEATIDLELELLNWCSSFTDLISTQKAYIEALNGWLMKWLFQEQEMTPDGVVPFSPSRVGAPSAFIISNDWYHTMERISVVEVTNTMSSFAARVHEMWEGQKREKRQKLKAEYLSRDFASRLKSLQRENGINGNLDVVSITDNGVANSDARMAALELMRKRLEEERVKHAETIKHIQEAASSSLREGLAPIFEALGSFTLEIVKAHEELRIPNGGRT